MSLFVQVIRHKGIKRVVTSIYQSQMERKWKFRGIKPVFLKSLYYIVLGSWQMLDIIFIL